MKLPSVPTDITLQWLIQVLKTHDPEIQLKGFSLKASASQNAHTALIQLQYTHKPSGAPVSLFYKSCPLDKGFVSDSEINYYTRDYQDLKHSPIPKCFASGRNEQGYFLLLEDLSATHRDAKELLFTPERAAECGQALARLHAHHWGQHVRKPALENYFDTLTSFEPLLFEALKGQWSQAHIDRLKTTLQYGKHQLENRLKRSQGQTLLHGDPNPTNWMVPIEDGPLFLIDRQPFTWSLQAGPGALDLAYLAVPFWPVETRRQCEISMLKRYAQTLKKEGIAYTFDDILSDYKDALCIGILTALSWQGHAQMRWLWELQLKRSLQAIEDWS